MVDAGDHVVERPLRDRRVAAIGVQAQLLLLEVLQQVGLQVCTRGDVHDLEDRRQRVVVIDGRIARHQLAEAVEQVLEPQHRADALVERVFVKDQGGDFVGRRGRLFHSPAKKITLAMHAKACRLVPRAPTASARRCRSRRRPPPGVRCAKPGWR